MLFYGKGFYFLIIALITLTLCFSSCTKIDLFEKIVSIPAQKWDNKFKPSFSFVISDTTVAYQLFVILRHTEKYNYTNLWIKLHTKSPDATQSNAQYELPLATNEKGWLGTGMDDIYEHRIGLTPLNQNFYFKKRGTYIFSIEHIMREEPLEHVMNIGLRIEKKPQ